MLSTLSSRASCGRVLYICTSCSKNLALALSPLDSHRISSRTKFSTTAVLSQVEEDGQPHKQPGATSTESIRTSSDVAKQPVDGINTKKHPRISSRARNSTPSTAGTSFSKQTESDTVVASKDEGKGLVRNRSQDHGKKIMGRRRTKKARLKAPGKAPLTGALFHQSDSASLDQNITLGEMGPNPSPKIKNGQRKSEKARPSLTPITSPAVTEESKAALEQSEPSLINMQSLQKSKPKRKVILPSRVNSTRPARVIRVASWKKAKTRRIAPGLETSHISHEPGLVVSDKIIISRGGTSKNHFATLESIGQNDLFSSKPDATFGMLEDVIQEGGQFQSLKQALKDGSPATKLESESLVKHLLAKPHITPAEVDNQKKKKTKVSKSKEPTKTRNSSKSRPKRDIVTIDASDLQLTPLDTGPLEVPRLSYGLERVLFNPGVYQLQDPRSRVFNFDPYLQTIMPVSEFDFGALKEYITSSKDTTLLDFAKKEKKKYTGSTSSMTSSLAHFHFLLSQWRPINAASLSKAFPAAFSSFTLLQRGPTAIFLRYKDGTYAIDADKEFDTANILSSLGKSMEKLLTLPTHDFERYRKPNSSQISEKERNEEEAFHYTTMGDFLMRSQLDAHDPRLPGTGMFDLKTRAVVAIRMDTSQYEEGSGYQIKSLYGEWESYEREYYDMIRSAFLKYSLQVRMGRMDGIFVAFHNTERIFGFQYVSLPEMDYALHGTHDTTLGDSEFKMSLDLLNRALDRATAKYPGKSLRLLFETRESATPFMYIFAEPVEEDEVDKIQNTNRAGIEEFESRVLGLTNKDAEDQERQDEWENLHSLVEQEMGKDELESTERVNATENEVVDSEGWTEKMRQEVHDFVSASAQDNDSPGQEGDDEEAVGGAVGSNNSVSASAQDDHGQVQDSDHERVGGDAVEAYKLEQDQQAAPDEEESKEYGSDLEEMRTAELAEEVHTSQQERSTAVPFDEGDPSPFMENADELPTYSQGNEAQLSPESDVAETNFMDTSGTHEIHESIEDSSAQDQDDAAPSPAETASADSTPSSDSLQPSIIEQDEFRKGAEEPDDKESDVFGMILTIRNKVNDNYVTRPQNLRADQKWIVEYNLEDVSDPARARKLYDAAKKRRSKTLQKDTSDDSGWSNQYAAKLMEMARRGRKWRQKLEEKEKDSPQKVLVVEQNTFTDESDRGSKDSA